MGEPNFDSHLVKRTHALMKIPLNKFNTEDLRLMIGQRFSLNYLAPLALDVLAEDILAEGDCYPGDLLQSVLKIDAQFWSENRKMWLKLAELLESNAELILENKIDSSRFYNNRPLKK